MICVELVEGCADCEAEGRYKESYGHECGSSGPMFQTMCEVFGDFRRRSESYHRQSHEPSRCGKCKMIVKDRVGFDGLVTKMCRRGWCTRWLCRYCGHEWASEGPLACPTCGSLPKEPRIRRLRQMYARRRR